MVKAVILDDERGNIETLQELLASFCSHVKVVASCSTVKEAAAAINAHQPDLVFLDVELKGETGFDLFTHFPGPGFGVIFTTAHEKYALRAIKSSCLEYLLKPINHRELAAAVEKFEKKKRAEDVGGKIETLLGNLSGGRQRLNKIAVPAADGYSFIDVDSIIYCQADLNYTRVVHASGDPVLSTRSLKEFEDMLDTKIFFRCHKSWLINLRHIKKYSRVDGTRVLMADDKWVDISVRKREEFLDIFEHF
jgi:two-component system, LytTR family, response regulator